MWGEIVQQRYRWDHGHRLAAAARLLTVEGLLDFFDQRMAHDGPERRLVVSHAFSVLARGGGGGGLHLERARGKVL